MLGRVFYDLVDEIDKVLQEHKGSEFLATLAQRYGLSHVAYLGINLPKQDDKEAYITTTYSDKWVRRYVSQHYVRIDPVIQVGLQGLLPLDWQTVRDSNPAIKRFFGEAGEFGVGRQGLSFPIRGLHGETAMFSINSHVSDAEWRKVKKEFMRDFQILAYHFHTHVLEEIGKLDEGPRQLSPREIECLKWAAAGKSAWETSRILGISSCTVEFYLEAARVKLNAVNKVQAVAKAVRKHIL
ncbi:MAG TPA: LuxR family transcriptional regulator [Hyphomicrobiaceae bacterium]|nr:LuxR family transcriptional regulator [Hyphomicrobiaceae bacterium]